MPSSALPIAIGSILAIAALLLFYRLRSRPVRPCADCGAPSTFGYSKHAESAREDIIPVCLKCLAVRLTADYKGYRSRALVIEPAANLPCYVFQPNSKWRGYKLAEETEALFEKLSSTCRHCERDASFLWMTSIGLMGTNFEAVLSGGLSQTLQVWGNPAPYVVCAGCCVNLIVQALEAHNLTFLEVCGPSSEDGFVISMGY